MSFKAIFIGFVLSLGIFSTVFAQEVVDINSADAATLASIVVGIGEVKAKAIVEYRDLNGLYSSVDELLSVKGIGKASLAKIRNQLVVSSGLGNME